MSAFTHAAGKRSAAPSSSGTAIAASDAGDPDGWSAITSRRLNASRARIPTIRTGCKPFAKLAILPRRRRENRVERTPEQAAWDAFAAEIMAG